MLKSAAFDLGDGQCQRISVDYQDKVWILGQGVSFNDLRRPLGPKSKNIDIRVRVTIKDSEIWKEEEAV